MSRVLTDDEAYAAMFCFLKRLYEQTNADYLGMLLGGMAVLEDGDSADPGYKDAWQKAVQQVLDERADIRFRLLPK